MSVTDTLAHFFKHPSMFIGNSDYYNITSFLLGYDRACNGGVLGGFEEWLLPKVKGGENLGWPALFLHYAYPKGKWPRIKDLSKLDQEKLVAKLFETLDAFFKERNEFRGLEKIYVRHVEWQQEQERYEVHEKAG